MSTPQPTRRAQPGSRVSGAIDKAKSNPTSSNLVDAIRAMHDDHTSFVEDEAKRWGGQWKTNQRLEAGINALLDHFDIPRPTA